MGHNSKIRQQRSAQYVAQEYKRVVPIKGMHCASCELLIADELESINGVTAVTVSLKDKAARIESTKCLSDSVIEKAVDKAGYEVGRDYGERLLVTRNSRIWKDVGAGFVLVAAIYILFRGFGIDKVIAGVSSTGGGNGVMALIIGLTAGFSTCMALIGGLVLSVASKYAESHPAQTALQKFKPHLYFNLGRVVSFVVLGALIGALGSAFALKGSLLGLLTIVVGMVMLVLGLQLTELFPRITRGLTLPSVLSKKLGITTRAGQDYRHNNAFIMGAATFFLPCGFTQAMQLLAVSTGSPVQAALIMGAFALGTTPGLLSLGGLISAVKGSFARRFFRIVGVAVVAMAFWNLANGYILMGFQFSLVDLMPKSSPAS